MDIHKPKPVRSWRELLTEVGIIVLSVCIALAAEQAVEWLHERSQLKQAREMLATELTRNIGRGVERVIKEQCLETLLDRATDIVDAASRSGTLPPVADIGGAPSRPWTRSAWNSVVGSPVAARFSREQMAQLALVYEDIQELSDTNKQETNAWTDVSAMIGPGRRMDPVLDNALHAALGRARTANRNMAILGGQMARAAQRIDLPYGDEGRKVIADFLSRRSCRPLTTEVPPRYGQAPASAYRNVVRDWQKYPPYVREAK
jgi:hypothetical protein